MLMGNLVLAVPVVPFSPARTQDRLPPAKPSETISQMVREVFSVEVAVRREALKLLQQMGDPSAIPGLIQALRFIRDGEAINTSLNALADTQLGADWHDWMLWQEAHPEIEPFVGFDAFKADVMALIDPEFRLFLERGINHKIRLEEIAWGSVRKDGIPALINPIHISPAEARYLQDDELVFGVAINGDARAYPLRILDWHEMFNDVVGDVPVALAYCTLCGSGILYETRVPSRPAPFVFGSSGFLYRSNKLMYDRQTNSLWNQFTGRPVVGSLTDSGIELKVRPGCHHELEALVEPSPGYESTVARNRTSARLHAWAPLQHVFQQSGPYVSGTGIGPALGPKGLRLRTSRRGTEKAWPLSALRKIG